MSVESRHNAFTASSQGSLRLSGLGHVSHLGQGIAALVRNDLQTADPFTETVRTARGPKSVLYFKSVDPELPDTLPANTLRRMPKICRTSLAAALEAMQGSRLKTENGASSDRIGLIVGTAYGCLDQGNRFLKDVLLHGPAGASPLVFANSIHSAIAAQLSVALKIQGPTFTSTTMALTTATAFALANDWIELGVVDEVLIVIGDEITDYHLYAAAHDESSILQALQEGFVAFLVSGAASHIEGLTLTRINSEAEEILKSEKALDVCGTLAASEGECNNFSSMVTRDAFVLARAWAQKYHFA